MRPYTPEVADYCCPFSCGDKDLDEFFAKDSFLYDIELLGKTYAWIDSSDTQNILGLVTLANDSVKAKYISGSARTGCNVVFQLPKEESTIRPFS